MRNAMLVAGVCVAAAVAAFAMFVGSKWRENADRGGQDTAEPFRIAGNFYYVGGSYTSAFLITGPAGHVVLDVGQRGFAPKVVASIAKLGFDVKDVKALLNSNPRPDTAGGLAGLQQASGAELWASAASADVIASGGDDPDYPLPMRALARGGLLLTYPPARVDHRLQDGETIRVGPIALTAHITGGGSRGCTSWSFPVRDSGRELNVVSACSFDVMAGARYPEQAADIERSLRVLRSLPVDIWVTAESRTWGRYRKFVASQDAKNPANAFIDPSGYRAYLDDVETEYRQGMVH